MAQSRTVWAVVGVSLIFIVVIVVLLFVLTDNPSNTLIIGILSCAFLAISGIFSAYLLRLRSSPMNTALMVQKVPKGSTEMPPYIRQEDDDPTVHVANMKQSRNSENAQMIPAETREEETAAATSTTTSTLDTDKLASENKRLTQEIAKLERHNKLILDEYREFQQKHRGMAEDVLSATKQIEQLDADNSTLRQQIQERDVLQTENESLQAQIGDLQTQMNAMQTALEASQQQFGDYTDIQQKCDALQQSLSEYEQRVNELDAKEQQLRDTEQDNRRLKQSIDVLQSEISQFKSLPASTPPPSVVYSSHDHASQSVDGATATALAAAAVSGGGQQEIRGQIQRLKQELAHAQKTIIEMTSVVSVNSVFPTVQEIIQQYRSIRDQRHHDTSTALKKWIKAHASGGHGADKWQKFYVNQCCHEIMFDILFACYASMRRYRLQIYDAIAEQLNMTQAIADSMELSATDMARDAHKQKLVRQQQYRLLSNIFGAYFKNNFKQVLQRKLMAPANAASEEEKDAVDDDVDGDDDDDDAEAAVSGESGGELVQTILAEIVQRPKYAAYALPDIGDSERASLSEYIIECCEVCWVMLLQDPPLQIVPTHWKCDAADASSSSSSAAAMHEHDAWHDDENDDEDDDAKHMQQQQQQQQPHMNGASALDPDDDDENANSSSSKGKQFKLMTVYNDDYHKRVLGSDRNCKKILYHVWPAVARKGVILGDQKIDVVLREEMYTPFKQKRNSIESIASVASNAAAV
eukprot:CAMPEP_0202690188 /NCGR_PEP_ID=MMETSP1385-20130828/5257_1 /ASSEMBLY_ACC=CAM_ASM_000861 /TAXON_ID=933848 /ORGANISM="Elphidium margaritaceum" /LENGTH=751 /DNA_ID=CAMNT_0049345423 /DNA_START=32 /DNA_END=2287 /DNA_ORIENTATION=-